MYEHVDHRFLFLVEMGGGGNLGVAKHNGVNACCEAEKHSTTCKNMVCSGGGTKKQNEAGRTISFIQSKYLHT